MMIERGARFIARVRLLAPVTDLVERGFRLLWLFADQGVFALTNFILNVLFARWLSATDYGIFAITFSGYLILTLIHYGMILEPLLVQSGKIEPRCHRSYIVTVFKAHSLANGAVIGACLLAMLVLLALGLRTAAFGVIGAGTGGMMLLTLLTARRLCLKFLTVRVSALIGLLYLSGVLISAYWLYTHGAIAWLEIWIILGVWAFLCSLVLFGLLYVETHGTDPYSLRTLYQFQMRYSYYATAGAPAQWLRVDGVLVLLASLVGIEAVAETRAMFTIISPMVQVNLALNTLWLVQSSEAAVLNQPVPVRQIAAIYGCILVVLTGLVWVFDNQLVQLIYGGRYLTGAWQLPFLLATTAFNGIELILTSDLKGRGHIWRGYAPPVVGAIVAMLLAWSLIPPLGTPGAIDAIVVSFGGGMLTSMLVFK